MATKLNGNAWAATLSDGKSVLIGIGNDTYIFDRGCELIEFINALIPHVIKPENSRVTPSIDGSSPKRNSPLKKA